MEPVVSTVDMMMGLTMPPTVGWGVIPVNGKELMVYIERLSPDKKCGMLRTLQRVNCQKISCREDGEKLAKPLAIPNPLRDYQMCENLWNPLE